MHPSSATGQAGTGEPVLELRDIRKAFGRVEALRGVSLTLRAGEVHAVMGDNGAGKSTLLKVAAGVVKPDGGEVRAQGAAVEFASPLDARRIGIETVYQDLALADHRSCVANVYIGREVRRSGLLGHLGVLDRAAMTDRTSQAFGQLAVPVSDVERPVRMLSGGQRQGVAIARAAIWAKTIVLLDEPTAALGVRQRAAVDELIKNLRSRHYGVLLISHDVPQVLEISDRVTVLRLGRNAGTRDTSDVDATWVVTAMVGGHS
ncbi:MAG: sugar ABC transporter ATP-binding protein [Thermoleophilaceae bacterium]|nr:sugar ABC transporter ATP-binding protein [Thermoleophilaceae bacterium]